MHSSFHSFRSKINQNKLTTSPIFGNKGHEHVKSGDYKFDDSCDNSTHNTLDHQSQQENPLSSSVISLNQSSCHQYSYKSHIERDQSYDVTYHPYTSNSFVCPESLTQKTESLMFKMEKFESKLEESKKLISNLRKERQDLMTQADRIDEILSNEASPNRIHSTRLMRGGSTNSSPGGRVSAQTGVKPENDSPRSDHLPSHRFESKKVSSFAKTSKKSTFGLTSDKNKKAQENALVKGSRSPIANVLKKVTFG